MELRASARVAADHRPALLVRRHRHVVCERAADVELLERLGVETSGNPLQDLVSAGVIRPPDVLRMGLEVLARLAELCRTVSVSVLGFPAPERG